MYQQALTSWYYLHASAVACRCSQVSASPAEIQENNKNIENFCVFLMTFEAHQ